MTESTRPVLKLKFPAKATIPPSLGNKIVVNVESADSLFTPKPAKATPKKIAVPKEKVNLMPNEEYKKLFKQLCTKYPKLFDRNNKRVRILATGVHKQVAAELGWNIKITRSFFFIFCNNKKYKAARVKGANRYDLQGKVVGKVE